MLDELFCSLFGLVRAHYFIIHDIISPIPSKSSPPSKTSPPKIPSLPRFIRLLNLILIIPLSILLLPRLILTIGRLLPSILLILILSWLLLILLSLLIRRSRSTLSLLIDYLCLISFRIIDMERRWGFRLVLLRRGSFWSWEIVLWWSILLSVLWW